jgi:CheY-like chemotaxis protein
MSADPKRVRAVVVEDEPHARHSLRDYARDVEWLTLVGEAGDGVEAVRLIDRLEPDLLFLDVSLPELSGLQVIERIRHVPEIVFTTAYDRFALAAFEVGALDYLRAPVLLLKPGLEGLWHEPGRNYMEAYRHKSWEGGGEGQPRFTVQTIPQSRVCLWLDQPEQVASAIAGFLQGLEPGPLRSSHEDGRPPPRS